MEVVYHTSKKVPPLSHFNSVVLAPPPHPTLSWSNIRSFHYFEVGMRSLMLDRLSEHPSGPNYSDISRYPVHTHTHTVLILPYLSHHTLGMILACGPRICEPVCVAKAAPRAVKTTSELSRRRDAGGARQPPFTDSNENSRRNERDPRVHANQYAHSESTVQICFH